MADDFEVIRKALTSKEEKKFARSFERQLLTPFKEGTVAQYFNMYRGEIQLACEVAKAQFNQSFDGERPAGGRFGMQVLDSFHFSGDDWDEQLSGMTTGESNDWIDQAYGALGGSASSALKIEESLVAIIMGVGTYSQNPGIAGVKMYIDGAPKTRLNTQFEFRHSDAKLKLLDTPIILNYPKTFRTEVFPNVETDNAYLFGVAFLTEDMMRKIDPANVTGAGNMVTT